MKPERSIVPSRRSRQRGQMSIEFVIVIGLVALVLGGIVYYLAKGRTASKVNDATAGITAMLTNTQSLYANDPSGYSTITAQALIDNGAVPDKMVNGTTITSPFGGPVTVASSTVFGGPAGSGVTFTINSVPSAACSDFVNGIAASFVNVKVGTSDVRTNGSNVAGYVAALGTACKAANVAVALTAGR